MSTAPDRAVFRSDGVDSPVPWHYGDPHAEQRALVGGTARVDLGHRDVVEVAGRDRLSWLHSLTTGWLTGMVAGDSAQALILDPTGHVEHDLHLVETGEACLITVEPGTGPILAAYLESMRFLLRVQVLARSADLAVAWSTTPEVPDAALAVWQQPAEFRGAGRTDAGVDRGGAADKYVPHRPGVLPGHELIIPRAALPEVVAGARPAGMWALEALRTAAAVPRLGWESDHRTLPHEAGWIGPAVHLAKGCYRGQEAVARVHNLGRPPRRLALAHLDGSQETLPAHGDPVLVDGRAVGWVATPARHYELGPIATVMLKRSVPTDAGLDVGGVAGMQEAVVVA